MERSVYRITTVTLIVGVLVGMALIVAGFLRAGAWGGPDERLIGVGLQFAFVGIVELIFVFAWRRDRWRVVAVPGTLASGLFLWSGLLLVWGNGGAYSDETLTRAMLATGSLSGALAFGSMLAFARLPAWWRLVRSVTWLPLAGFVLVAMVFAVMDPFDQTVARWYFALLTVSLTGGIAVLVLHLTVGAWAAPRPVTFAALRMQIVCPRCDVHQEIDAGPSRCRQCGLRFTLEIEEERCAKCGYTVYQLTSHRCPECGHVLFEHTPASASGEPPAGDGEINP